MWAFWRRNEPGGPAVLRHARGARARLAAAAARAPALRRAAGSGSRPPTAATRSTAAARPRTRVGADAKLNLTSNLTLDATINPDFGQVEVDPAVVNLSAFEVFFQEKRPFFVANASAFSFGTFKCFFCSNVVEPERVLLAPHRPRRRSSPASCGGRADYVDVPDDVDDPRRGEDHRAHEERVDRRRCSTRSRTARTRATCRRGAAPARGAVPQRRRSSRSRTTSWAGCGKDLRGGDTRVGGIATLANRALAPTPSTRTRLRRGAQAVGLDLAHYWKQRDVRVRRARPSCRTSRGDTAAMRRTQQHERALLPAPRPHRARADGAVRRAYDPRRTSLRGYGALRAPREGERRLALGDRAELAQPRLRGERHRVPEPRRLQVDERERRAAVDEADELVSQRVDVASAGSSSTTTTATAPTCRRSCYGQVTLPSYYNVTRLRHPPPARATTTASRAAARR